MKPVKITAEITLTPETFSEWCDGDVEETERMYQHYVEKTLYYKFGTFGMLVVMTDFINKTIDDNGNGLKLTIEELK
jgi:hypothetical protein